MTKTVLVYSDTHDRCGVGSCNVALLKGLKQAGYRAVYCKPREESPPQRELTALGVEFRWLDFAPDSDPTRFANDRDMPTRVYEEIRPDLVFFGKGQPLVLYGAIEAARVLSLPYIVWEGSVAADMLPKPDQTDVIGVMRQQYEQAAAAICLSRDNLTALHAAGLLAPDKGTTVPAPADPAFFSPVDPDTRRRIRGEWGVGEDTVVCLTGAQLEPFKGHAVQVLAMRLLKDMPEWRRLCFVWAGDGSQRPGLADALERFGVADHVRMLGHVWNMHELMDAADIFVLTSTMEGMGRVFPEAMAKGLPIVATGVGGAPEAVGEHAVLLSAPTDPHATAAELADAITAWVNDEAARKAFGAAARTERAPDFFEPAIVERYLEIIGQALSTGGRAFTPA